MHLYNLTLQQPSAVRKAVVGSFTGGKAQEIVLAKGSSIELVRVEVGQDESARVVQLAEVPIFGLVRSLASFRVTGGSKDYIIVGSDSGRIAILEYMPAANAFHRVHMETFGKSGVRRIVPGEYVATDPKGRAVMIGALEKQKFVYILNRDSATRLTISSPLEGHKANVITFDLVGIDVGFENPIFAAIEVDYTEVDTDPNEENESPPGPTKMLTYYELDLGLNHVVRKWTDPIDPSSNLLIQVPGGSDGPSGVLVCCENWIWWRHQDQPELRVPIPRRVNYLEDPDRGLVIVASVTHRLKNRFFVILQSEEGDLYRVTMKVENETVQDLEVKYFDTVPVATALVILKSGYLLVLAEFGNHHLYRIDELGDKDDEQVLFTSSETTDDSFVYFKPRELRNLALVHVIEASNPLMDAKVLNLTQEEAPQLYGLCGRGAQSSFRIICPGLEMLEIAVTEVPASPTNIWTAKMSASDEVDSYIVVSFTNATVVFAVGETVEEVTDSGFLGEVSTLLVRQIGDDDLVQVHPEGIRHIKSDKRTFEWKSPAGRKIVCAAANQRQVMVSLNEGELIYFELDGTGILNEYPERKNMPSGVTCIDLGNVPTGRLRNRFVAVGCADNTVRVLSLDPDTCMEGLSMQALNSLPESLCMVEMRDPNVENGEAMYLNIGLNNGVLIRSTLDQVSGELIDSRLRFLGPRSPRLIRLRVGGQNAMMALSTRTWLNYTFQGHTHMNPVNYSMLESAAGFASELYADGVVATSGNTVRIIVPDKLARPFHQQSVELSYTPRKFVHQPISNHFVILEADQNTYAPQEASQLLEEKSKEYDDETVVAYRDEFPESRYGLIKAAKGKWASCIRILNPIDGVTSQIINLDPDEAAVSMAVLPFAARPHDLYLCVGVVKQFKYPREFKSAAIYTYMFIDNGVSLEFVHSTVVDDVPLAMAAFQGRLLAGVGKLLRIYDIGRKQLLRKAENRQIPALITSISVQNNRLYISDIQEAMHVALYRYQDNKIVVFADDSVPRWVTAMACLDYDTMACGDRFGSLVVNRLPRQLSKEIEDDPTGNRVMYEKPFLNSSSHKLEHIANFFVGDWITSLNKTTLVPGGREVLLYTTLGGMVGCLVPFASKDDAEFFQLLEVHMREESESLIGRDQMRYRSFFAPTKNVTDGDLCESFLSLPHDKKKFIAQEMDRTIVDVTRRIEDLRARSAF